MVDFHPERRAAQGRPMPAVPIAGDLLVASVGLVGDAFDHTVVLLIDVDDGGATGVVLNRLTETDVDEILPGWGDVVTAPGTAACGGPVALDGALCVGRLKPGMEAPEGWQRSHADLWLVPLDADPALAATHFEPMRVFVGYAGWRAGQLQQEIAADLWHVLPSRAGDVFLADPDDLWRTVLRRAPGELAYFSAWTATPELN